MLICVLILNRNKIEALSRTLSKFKSEKQKQIEELEQGIFPKPLLSVLMYLFVIYYISCYFTQHLYSLRQVLAKE